MEKFVLSQHSQTKHHDRLKVKHGNSLMSLRVYDSFNGQNLEG